jgi:hypothetical protein
MTCPRTRLKHNPGHGVSNRGPGRISTRMNWSAFRKASRAIRSIRSPGPAHTGPTGRASQEIDGVARGGGESSDDLVGLCVAVWLNGVPKSDQKWTARGASAPETYGLESRSVQQQLGAPDFAGIPRDLPTYCPAGVCRTAFRQRLLRGRTPGTELSSRRSEPWTDLRSAAEQGWPGG